MTSTQTRPARDGVDVPSQFAAIDAVKGQSEIAQSADGRRTARRQERTAAAPSPGHLARGDAGSPIPGSRDGDVVVAHHSTSGRDRKPRQVGLISPPGDGGVRMSLSSAAALLVWPLSTDCAASTWT